MHEPIEIEGDFNKGVRISVLLVSKNFTQFNTVLRSISDTCSCKDVVEILVKIDSESGETRKYIRALRRSRFNFKILCYPSFQGYRDTFLFLNDLARLSYGELLMPLDTHAVILSGDWVSALLETRDMFKDNVYAIHMRVNHMHLDQSPCPVITKEWRDVLGCYSPFHGADGWVTLLAKRLNRFVSNDITQSIKFCHSPGLHDPNETSSTQVIIDKIEEYLPKFKKAILDGGGIYCPDESRKNLRRRK